MLNLAHKKMDVWIASNELVKEIYASTKIFPHDEMFGIISQLRRASISVVSNISEGLSRFSNKEKQRFLEIARSSLVEVDTQIELSIQLKFCAQDQIKNIEELVTRIFAMLSNLIKSYS